MPWSRWSGASCDKLLGQLHQPHLRCAVLHGRCEGPYARSAAHHAQGTQGLQLNQPPLEQRSGPRPPLPILVGEVVVDVGNRKKQLRLLLCKLWKAPELSCMLPSRLLHSAVMLRPWAALPKPLPCLLLYCMQRWTSRERMLQLLLRQ